jgi:uncharacterized membrane protein (UPF0127 family)
MRLLIVTLAALALFCASCTTSDGGNDSTPIIVDLTPAATSTTELPVIELSYREGVLLVEVASTPEQRSKGLGGRASLAEDTGMLFDLGETRVPSFSMRDTLIALDFIWVSEDRRIQGIVADVQPVAPGEPLAPYSPTEPVRYVLEVNGGTAARLGLEPGDQLEFELP